MVTDMADGSDTELTPKPRVRHLRATYGSYYPIGPVPRAADFETAELMEELIERLGGPHAVIEQLTAVLEEGVHCEPSVVANDVDEDTSGYCYLRLFDRVEHRDAAKLGPNPSVAALRRFSNGRSDPFGSRGVVVQVLTKLGARTAHVTYNSGVMGMRPIVALSALAKDCAVGADVLTLGTPLSAPLDQSIIERHGVHPIKEAPGLPHEDEEASANVFASSNYITVRLAKVLEMFGHCSDHFGAIHLVRMDCATFACVPSDLPFNIPSPDAYPYSRYAGLQDFLRQVGYIVAWDFIVDLGGTRDQTPNNAFWHKSFQTTVVIAAYLKLRSADRQTFVRTVIWIREPIPGRPGGVQIPPPPWPESIPTPVHHAMTRYAGIADWVASLDEPWQVLCRMSLFGIHEPFDPAWWADYHKTVDVYTLYSRLNTKLRQGFNETVFWIPDAGIDEIGKAIGHEEFADGFCYLLLFRAGRRSAARATLGANPWASAVIAYIMGSPGCGSTNTFELSVRSVQDGHSVYQQGHITEALDGFDVAALVGLTTGTLRLGASNDLNALMDIQGEEQIAVQPTVFPTNPIGGGAGLVLSFNLYALLGKDPTKYPSINFNILREPAFALLLGSFESVQLVKAVFHIEVATGAQNSVWAAVTGPDATLISESDWLSAAINMVVRGSDAGYVRATMHLPDVHPFEKELRASSSVGNPPPAFRFSFGGSANGTGSVKGQIVVRVRGQYPLGHIRVGAPAVGKSLATQADRVVASLPRFKVGRTVAPGMPVGDEEDDDDDSDDQVPVRKSLPKANSSNLRPLIK